MQHLTHVLLWYFGRWNEKCAVPAMSVCHADEPIFNSVSSQCIEFFGASWIITLVPRRDKRVLFYSTLYGVVRTPTILDTFEMDAGD